jgi:hypothetical protein
MFSEARVAATVAAVLCATACSSTDTTPKKTDACPQNGTVPANLRDVERSGEGLVSATFGEYPARTPDWSRAATVLSLLEDVWTKTKAECPSLPGAETQAIDDAVSKLDASVPAQDQAASTTAANAVGLAVPPLFDYFHPDIPLEIVGMDAVYRQIGLDAHFGDWPGVAADIASLDADWAGSKARVQTRTPTCHRVGGTATVADDIDQSLANLKTASSTKDATTSEQESENGALEIDTLELLFDCPPDGPPPKSGLGAICTAKADCSSGEVCDTANAGGTCAPDPASASVGAACNTTVDCGSDPRAACLTQAGDGFPGGYCGMEPCDDVQVCPPGATCVSMPHETPGCLQSCASDADCRASDGYVCQLFPTTPPGGFGPSATACAFECQDDQGCTSPLLCDVASGRCKP